jgi:hypothetical protein
MINVQEIARMEALLIIDATHKIITIGVAASVKYAPQFLVVDKKGHNWKFYYRGDNKATFKTIDAARTYILAHI